MGYGSAAFFLPYRYAASVCPPTGYPALGRLFRHAEPDFNAVLGDIIGLAADINKLERGDDGCRLPGNTFYILDEPTTGLHFEDIRVLMEVLNKLVDKGNTILVIEHNMDVIKMADYIIDIGYEGGRGGGMVVAKGTPEEVAKDEKSYTAFFLRKELVQTVH